MAYLEGSKDDIFEHRRRAVCSRPPSDPRKLAGTQVAALNQGQGGRTTAPTIPRLDTRKRCSRGAVARSKQPPPPPSERGEEK